MILIPTGLRTLLPAAGHCRLPAEPRGPRATQRQVEAISQSKPEYI